MTMIIIITTTMMMMITTIATTIIMIVIAFKGANRDFLQSPHSGVNRLQYVRKSGLGAIVVQITCNTSSAYHVQHVVFRATWLEGTAPLLSLTELNLHLFELLLSEPLTDEGGEETGVPGENLWRLASQRQKFQSKLTTQTRCTDTRTTGVSSNTMTSETRLAGQPLKWRL